MRKKIFLAVYLLAAGALSPAVLAQEELVPEEACIVLEQAQETEDPVWILEEAQTETGGRDADTQTDAGTEPESGTEAGTQAVSAGEALTIETIEEADSQDPEGVYYTYGRPMTEEEIAAQQALEPELQPLLELPVISEPVTGLYQRGVFPASYDSRDYGWVTPVKNQNPYGVCWAFSVVSAAETSLLKNGLASGSPDLSELHLAYFLYHRETDPLELTAGDSNVRGTGSWLDGGNTLLATQYLTEWSGLVSESRAPYETAGAALSPGDAYLHDALLQNYYSVSCDTEQLKNAILEYGSVFISISYSSAYMNYSTSGYSNPVSGNVNHSVTIVGWNDDYSANNFNAASGVSSDGAWIVKNTYGTEWGDDGYFYVSYEDASLSSAGAVKMQPEAVYDHNYFYDGSVAPLYHTVSSGTKIANLFEIQGEADGRTELLQAVGFSLWSAQVNYSIQIYKNPTDAGNPESGKKMLRTPVTGTTTYAGSYTIPLNQELCLEQGDQIAVVITLTKSSGTIRYGVEQSYNYEWIIFQAATAAGQSFCSTGDGWTDLNEENECARIKAYTVTGDFPLTETEKLITEAYEEILGREPDAVGFAHYKSLIDSGSLTAAAFYENLFASDEFRNRAVTEEDYVEILYRALLGRESDAAGRASHVRNLQNGVSWRYVLRDFVESAEFSDICQARGIAGGTITLTQNRDQRIGITAFVQRCYVKALGRNGEEGGMNHWTGILLNGDLSWKRVAEEFILSREFTEKGLDNEAFVQVLYRVFLDREYDAEGLAHWCGMLDSGSSRSSVLSGFSDSGEFQALIRTF